MRVGEWMHENNWVWLVTNLMTATRSLSQCSHMYGASSTCMGSKQVAAVVL